MRFQLGCLPLSLLVLTSAVVSSWAWVIPDAPLQLSLDTHIVEDGPLQLGDPTPPSDPPGPKLPPPTPLVLWHGLGALPRPTNICFGSSDTAPCLIGDTYISAGMTEFIQLIKGIHPGIFVHSVYLNQDPQEDQKAGWVRMPHVLPERVVTHG